MAEAEYDVVVVGAGSTGEVLAGRITSGGLTAALVEAELVGGDCSYWACMPSKALLRPGNVLAQARGVDGSRQAVSGALDASAVLKRRDSFTSNWNDEGQVSWVEGEGIELFRGQGRLTGERRVEVTGPDGEVTVLLARQAVVLATGSSPALPPIEGLADIQPWTSHEATSSKVVPGRLTVVGGGVVACEMATAWRTLGSEVVMLVRGSSLLPGMEPFAGELVERGLREQGVDVRTGISARLVSRSAATSVVTAELSDGSTLESDEFLVATGRTPRTGGLGLESVGLESGSWLDVDDTCLVRGVDGQWLYAAGDLNNRALLTHMGKYQARACGAAILGRAAGKDVASRPWAAWSATADLASVPQVVFTYPEAASVGLTEQQARDAGRAVRAVEYAIGNVAGAALFEDGYTGRAKMVVDTERETVLGCTLVGPEVGELLHAATVAIVGEVPLSRLWHAVPSYPTVGELWLRLLEEYGL
jgi:pyruvate/2-oxoglutarate dehydrogenase complex dihydrolipoamide dehydrogenase (E3) component